MRRSPASLQFEPTEAEIQQEAYHLWLESGCPTGRDVEHWFAAKELLRHRHARSCGHGYRRGGHSMSAPASSRLVPRN